MTRIDSRRLFLKGATSSLVLAAGPRLDVFVAAMLGRLEIVQALLTAWPPLIESRGPHGISLLRHARAGGEPARGVVDYLLARGAK